MARTLSIIGIEPEELAWIRLLVQLLRHPDPVAPELARQALLYLEASVCRSGGVEVKSGTKSSRNSSNVPHC
jgi:hypothetical protein